MFMINILLILLSNSSMPIPSHQVFVSLSAFKDLIAKFLPVAAHAASKRGLEGFEGVDG